jgi:hypothetical protein
MMARPSSPRKIVVVVATVVVLLVLLGIVLQLFIAPS